MKRWTLNRHSINLNHGGKYFSVHCLRYDNCGPICWYVVIKIFGKVVWRKHACKNHK